MSQSSSPSGATNPWVVTATLMIGTLAAVMGASTINTALADISSGLAIGGDQLSWVSTSYMLANVIAIPSAAWLGNVLGKRVLFGLGLLMFMLGSILSGLSWSFESLIAFRVLQGLGAGLVMPTSQAVMYEVFPPAQRGAAMGVYGLGVIMGPAIGPTVGGYLSSVFGWRSIFFINIPFAVTSLLMLATLPQGNPNRALKFDAPGFVSMALFLTTLQIAVSNGAKDGWDAPYIIGCFVVSFFSFAFMIYHELTTEKPLLDLSVFRFPLYNMATLVSMIVGIGLFGVTFLVPVYMGTLLGWTSLQIGLILLPGSLAMGVAMLLSGRFSHAIDPRLMLLAGVGLLAYGLHMQAEATPLSPESYHAWAQVWRGIGIGLSFTPLSILALGGVAPQQIAQATGLFNLTRQLAGSIAIAALNTMLTTRATYHSTMIGQAMSAQSTTYQQFMAGAKQMLIARGMLPSQATLGASSMLGGLFKQQTMVLAFCDLFQLCLWLVVAAIVPSLILKPPGKAKSP